ncbi:terminase small subunit [Staphylococcus sp. SQ8-PEA]|uniref:Terminase small subunit n=1 Tax=Staphylococcus marylandisciuri TaxID=2981529 RepID=A0ABT2QPJ0_9STAP|nr:terminase small subunit [Staphylococcus marylandisciuri]MCU5745891.1 terminase small subunit [Staphylococcus marylandisciuri]
MKLTLKQQLFADEYIRTGNAYQSAINAGYSHNYANKNSSKLLGNVGIKSYIDARLEELKKETIAEQDEILQYLTSVMRREHKEHVVVTLNKEESKWVRGKKQTKKEDVAEIVEIPSKLSDANKAAELLGKRYVMWTDKQEITQRNIEIDIGEYDDTD